MLIDTVNQKTQTDDVRAHTQILLIMPRCEMPQSWVFTWKREKIHSTLRTNELSLCSPIPQAYRTQICSHKHYILTCYTPHPTRPSLCCLSISDASFVIFAIPHVHLTSLPPPPLLICFLSSPPCFLFSSLPFSHSLPEAYPRESDWSTGCVFGVHLIGRTGTLGRKEGRRMEVYDGNGSGEWEVLRWCGYVRALGGRKWWVLRGQSGVRYLHH